MGKTILTPKQLDFLELIQSEPHITKRFYFTGGTALAEYYLKHRLSEDIDLFTEQSEVNQVVIKSFLKRKAWALGVTKIKESQFLGLYSYKLLYDDGEELKVDFLNSNSYRTSPTSLATTTRR
ncbi:nucleotidyl transferase AbiEii/AbiGii toxin family protein [Candidatus Gottesmanbacteria bacterium]|nr:nucleotidyl transferase AbiEii/AbiGii toxin family protein [Candidatus Gottesmanbacteria bacterium]